jgi:hypothetical protein
MRRASRFGMSACGSVSGCETNNRSHSASIKYVMIDVDGSVGPYWGPQM